MKRGIFSVRRPGIVITGYLLAAFAILGGFILLHYHRAENYRRQAAESFRRTFTELAAEVSSMDSALQKCGYAGTPPMIAGVCADIYGKSRAAITALNDLPVPAGGIEHASGFLSKVGDYAYVLARKAGSGETLGDEEFENLKRLSGTASVLSGNITRLLSRVSDSSLSADEIYKAAGEANLLSGAAGAETPGRDDPSLSTDDAAGLPKLLKGTGVISQGDASIAVSDFMGIRRNKLKYTGERGGALPVHIFTSNISGGALNIEITKRGGYIVSVNSSRTPMSKTISLEEASEFASNFLQKNGFGSMVMTRSVMEDTTAFFNFANKKDGVMFYPDEITIRIGLDNGGLIDYNCLGYIMNHHERELPKAEINEEDAKEKISARLSVLSHSMAVIAAADENELFCHEFKCESESGGNYLVYINAVTGAEEKLLTPQEGAAI